MNLEKSVHAALRGPESWEFSEHPSDPSVMDLDKGKKKRQVKVGGRTW